MVEKIRKDAGFAHGYQFILKLTTIDDEEEEEKKMMMMISLSHCSQWLMTPMHKAFIC